MTVLPREPEVSFEYHLFGALAGLAGALLFFRLDPAPPRKRYSWELEEEQTEPLDEELESGPSPHPPRARVIAFPAQHRGPPTH